MQNALMQIVEESTMLEKVPEFEIGDTVDVHVRILEGEKERIQIFNGVVIARSGASVRETFIVRRIVQGEGVERIFPVHSPRIAKVVVKRSGKVRRAKLYYLRGLTGKAVRLKERFKRGTATAAEAKAAKQEKRRVRIEAKKAKKARKQQLKEEQVVNDEAVTPTDEAVVDANSVTTGSTDKETQAAAMSETTPETPPVEDGSAETQSNASEASPTPKTDPAEDSASDKKTE